MSGLTVAYGDKPALVDVSYTVPKASLVAVVGPNGAGKSTLVKAVMGQVQPLFGSIAVFGRPVRRAKPLIGYVPQRTSVDWDFPVSALEVVAMGLYRRIGWLRPVRKRHRDTARGYLAQMGLEAHADRQIGQLSGGQQQRVFLARALAQEAALYLMDEPFAGVDAATESAIIEVLRRLKAEGRTVVVVHHDLQTVPDYFDEVAILNTRLVEAGPVGKAFTLANLQHAYGGRLALTPPALPDN